jgi:hypothetical protein
MSSPPRRVPAAILELSDESNSPPDLPALPENVTRQQPEPVTQPQYKRLAAVPVKRPAAGSEEEDSVLVTSTVRSCMTVHVGEHLQPEHTENEAEDEAAPAVVGPRVKDDMPGRPRNGVKKRPASCSEFIEDRYKLMTYKTHGESGTVAIRDKVSGMQIVEMKWLGVTCEQSLVAAQLCVVQLNCGVELAVAKEYAQQFKAEYITNNGNCPDR